LHSSWTDAQKKASPGAASTEEWSKYAGRKVEAGFWVALAYVVLLRSELLATLLYDDLIHTASLYAALGLVAINVCIGVYLYVFVQFRQGITVRPGLPACLFFFFLFFFFSNAHTLFPPNFRIGIHLANRHRWLFVPAVPFYFYYYYYYYISSIPSIVCIPPRLQDWNTHCPEVIYAATFIGLAQSACATAAIWPVYGWLSPVILFVLFLGFLNCFHFLPSC
jgi:hypothetical protein